MTWNLIGHEWAVKLFRGHIDKNSLRHAYLITGPTGIGKKNLAIRFIQAMSCQETPEIGSPCLSCPNCQRINRMQHPDLFPVAIEENSSRIKIDQIRELVRDLSLSPYEITRRFGLLINFEGATIPAQNSLLKTLEEPPGKAILILTALSSESLLETITSRCEEIKLHPVPISTTSQGLQKYHGIQEEQASFLAHISGGKPDLALQYHQDPSALDHRETLLNEHYQILTSNSIGRFSYASRVEKDPLLAHEIINIWSGLWHDILRQAGQSKAPMQNIDQSDQINQIVKQIDLQTAIDTINKFRRAHRLLLNNANLKLTVEDLLLQLPQF
jgi:DNA polymerase-3 subunit delta'